jgi:hypothetical protein
MGTSHHRVAFTRRHLRDPGFDENGRYLCREHEDG